MQKTVGRLFPIFRSIKGYSRPDFFKDLNAGIIVAVILIPQSMAYAMLAGMPPIYGLYAGLIPLFMYALLGTSRQMSIGPVAITSLLVLAGLSTVAEPFSQRYIELAIMTGILAGVLQFLLGLLRMGWLVNFLSRPVITGFSSAAAVVICISQFKDIFGFRVEGSSSIDSLLYTIQHIAETHWLTLIVSISCLAILLLLKKVNRKIPGALIVVLIATLLCYYFNWNDKGLEIIGSIPSGLPAFSLGEWSMEDMRLILPTVLTVGIIGTVECLSIAKVLESKTKNHIVRPNRELLAIGVSKIAGGFFQAMPSSGSFSRSAVSNEKNAYSQISSLVVVVITILTLLFWTDLFYYMPKAVLAAIILQSVFGLFEWKEAIHLWKVHRPDMIMLLATFAITLIFGIKEGVFLGMLLSVLMVLYKSTKPHVAELGNVEGTSVYRNIERFEISSTTDDILILRFDDQLYYGNASFFKDIIRNKVRDRIKELKYVLIDCSNIHAMDSTGAHALKEIEDYLAENEITLHLSGSKGPLRDMLSKCGLRTELHKHHMSVHSGIQAIRDSIT